MHERRDTLEENWCNEFASGLLMPKAEMVRYLSCDREQMPRKLLDGCYTFQVSEDAFLSQVANITGWIICFLNSGDNVHRTGKRFARRGNDQILIARLMDDLVSRTRSMPELPGFQIALPGFMAYATLKSATRVTRTYLACLMVESQPTANE